MGRPTKEEQRASLEAQVEALGDPLTQLATDPPTEAEKRRAIAVAGARLRTLTSLHGLIRVMADDEAQAEHKATLRKIGPVPGGGFAQGGFTHA